MFHRDYEAQEWKTVVQKSSNDPSGEGETQKRQVWRKSKTAIITSCDASAPPPIIDRVSYPCPVDPM